MNSSIHLHSVIHASTFIRSFVLIYIHRVHSFHSFHSFTSSIYFLQSFHSFNHFISSVHPFFSFIHSVHSFIARIKLIHQFNSIQSIHSHMHRPIFHLRRSRRPDRPSKLAGTIPLARVYRRRRFEPALRQLSHSLPPLLKLCVHPRQGG